MENFNIFSISISHMTKRVEHFLMCLLPTVSQLLRIFYSQPMYKLFVWGFLLLRFCLYFLANNSMQNVWTAKIFSCSTGSFFLWLTFSLVKQKLFNFTRPVCQFLSFPKWLGILFREWCLCLAVFILCFPWAVKSVKPHINVSDPFDFNEGQETGIIHSFHSSSLDDIFFVPMCIFGILCRVTNTVLKEKQGLMKQISWLKLFL